MNSSKRFGGLKCEIMCFSAFFLDKVVIKHLTICFFLAFAFGCASQGKGLVWYQPGKTSEQVNRDLAACEYEAAKNANPLAMTNLGFALADKNRREEMIRTGMMAKGYQLVDPKNIPTHVDNSTITANSKKEDREKEIALIGYWECSSNLPPLSVRSGVTRLVLKFQPQNQLVAASYGQSSDSQPYNAKATYSVRGDQIIVHSPGSTPDPMFFILEGDRLLIWTSNEDKALYERKSLK